MNLFLLNATAKEESKTMIAIRTGADGNSGMTTSTVIAELLAALLPATSFTIKVTVNVPTLEYVCVGVIPVPVVPSPKFQR